MEENGTEGCPPASQRAAVTRRPATSRATTDHRSQASGRTAADTGLGGTRRPEREEEDDDEQEERPQGAEWVQRFMGQRM